MARCRLKMAPHLAPQKLVSSANVRMVEHHIAPWTLKFLSRHMAAVGADVTPMSPEACEDRYQVLSDHNRRQRDDRPARHARPGHRFV